jgi:purine-cytosine permease-like protein
MDAKPSLIEPGIRNFVTVTLKQCHQFRTNYENYIFNITLAITLILVIACVLYLKYRGKPSLEEKRKRDNIKKEYILSRIQNFQEARDEMHQRLVTDLPKW